MLPLRKGRYTARLAQSPQDLAASLALRARCFRDGAPDADAFDPHCRHMVVNETKSGQIVCTFRLMSLRHGGEIGQSYSAQFYRLDPLAAFGGPMVEMGRFCIASDAAQDVDILRLAWGAMTAVVDASGVELLFGCASFPGTETHMYQDAFAMLRDRYLAPARWSPQIKAPHVVRFEGLAAGAKPDPRRAMMAMPPLLRSYLSMGGRVSDHAVVDQDLGTLHVFTGLEIRAIPSARARALRAVAG